MPLFSADFTHSGAKLVVVALGNRGHFSHVFASLAANKKAATGILAQRLA
jgi:hypothetical protein